MVATDRVSIQLCGEVRVEVDGRRRERELSGRLGRVLLGYLALNRRRAVTRDELIEALWPHGAPPEARATLSTLLSGLRRTLGPELVQGRGELQLVLPDGARVDVEQALADLDHARSGADVPAAHRALEVLERILLPGFDAPWLDERRRELDEERLAALELLARAASPHIAQAAARRLVALAPFRESGYALLMEAQAAQGNVAEALHTFERLRTVMRDELGTVPSPELRAAHQRLLEGSAALPLPAALERIARRPFVGRGDVLRALHERLAGGERRFVFLAGEPGIGKTSVAAAFALQAHARGDTVVLYGRCDEDALAPYQPFVEMLGQRFDELVGRGEVERYRLFEAVTRTLARLAGGGALVLVCDDLHWADAPTLQLVRHLARAAVPERLLLIGAYRDVETGPPLHDLIADLRREHAFERMPLAGLDGEETGALLTDLGRAEAERLRELTNGNPLFLGELARALAEDGATSPVPEGIKEVLLRRVGRLLPPAHGVLTLAAVAGQQFSPALLETEASPEVVVDVLDEALAAGLVVGTEQPERLAFAHALIRQTLYEQLSDTRRVRLHQRIAQTLEARRAELRPEPAELAHHFFRARHVAGAGPAIRYAREAAARAAESLAWEDEALQLERALEAGPEPAERAELLLALGEARVRFGHAASRAAFADAAALARGHSPEQLARAAIGYGGRYYEAGVIDPELIALLREALEVAGDTGARAHLLARLAEILHFAGECEESMRLATEAVTLARSLGDDRVLAAALAGRHHSLLHVAHVEERMRIGREILTIADRTQDPQLEMPAVHSRIFDRLTLGDVIGARQDLARLDALAQALREPFYVHLAVGWSCTFAQIDGDLEEAERLALQSFELRQQLQTRDAEAVLAAQLFMIRRAQGRVSELLPAVAAAVEQYPALAAWRAAMPLVHLDAGDETRARAALDELVSGLDAIPRDFFWLTALTLLSEACLPLHAAEPAARLYAALAPYPTRFLQIGYAASDGPVARSLGLLAATRGDTTQAIAHLEHALELCAGAPAFEARARADLYSVSTTQPRSTRPDGTS